MHLEWTELANQLTNTIMTSDSPMPYHAHFLDFDHTLFDSDTSEAMAFEAAMASAGVTSAGEPAEVDALFGAYSAINRELWAEVEAGRRNPDSVRDLRFTRLTEQAGLDVDSSALAAAFTTGMQEFGELYPGAMDVISALRERGPVALVTNAISAIQRRRMERVGVTDQFDAIVISSEIGHSKPSTTIFDHAFELLGALDKSATLMVGDSLTSDMAGGRAAGIATCWFNPTGRARDPAVPVDHEITRLDQLLVI